MRQWQRRAALLLIDVIGLNGAVLLGLAFRFDSHVPAVHVWHALRIAVPYTAVGLMALYSFGQYRTLFRYADVDEVWRVAGAVTLATTTFITLTELLHPQFPASVYALMWLFSVVCLGGARQGRRLTMLLPQRLQRRSARRAAAAPPRRVLIVGAGEAGAIVTREMVQRPHMGRVPVALLDDDPHKQRLEISGVPVRGTRADLQRVAAETEAEEVVVAIPSAGAKVLREVVDACGTHGLPVLTVPGVYELLEGKVTVNNIRAVQLEDLIGREPVRLNLAEIAGYLRGQVVLVTGAAGSIGSELCRQVARFQPGQLIMLDQDESGLFEMGLELKRRFPNLVSYLAIGDIRNLGRMDRIFRQHRPAVIFHAAAHKHVPLMEAQADEAVVTNVTGTRHVAEAAQRHGARLFVMISTDKAVNPTSVMGATKRVAEMLCQRLSVPGGIRYVSVRFGNVLGSRGSVVPLFRRQIAHGGPVTVTDPEMQRYFMTIEEAVQLVIQAGAMGQGGEVFVLDMGEPIRIVDLARNLIRLSGFEPDTDIPIVFTGMRPGEKLFEELLTAEEGTEATRHERIFFARTTAPDAVVLEAMLAALESDAAAGRNEAVIAALHQTVPSYTASPAPGLAVAATTEAS